MTSTAERAARIGTPNQLGIVAAPLPGTIRIAKTMGDPPPTRSGAEIQPADESQKGADLAPLRLLAETLNDYQKMRIAAENRAKRGGVDPSFFEAQIKAIERTEKELEGVLRAEYRRSVPASIREWQAGAIGLGEHSFARLIGHLGHPRIATPKHWEGGPAKLATEPRKKSTNGSPKRILVEDPPYYRSVSQLWSYCGVGDPNRKRRSGMEQEDALACGSPRLRSLLFVISESCVKNRRSPYRAVYEEARLTYADRLHKEPCVRCGPKGHPAKAGSPWSKPHQHAAAMRLVAKEILRDLWVAAGDGGHSGNEAQSRAASSSAAGEADHLRSETYQTCVGSLAAGDGTTAANETQGSAVPSSAASVVDHRLGEIQCASVGSLVAGDGGQADYERHRLVVPSSAAGVGTASPASKLKSSPQSRAHPRPKR